jgi:NAD(P)H dehydrogenase (quinone)
VAKGANESKGSPDCEMIEIDAGKEIDWQLLQGSDAIIFGSPTFMGNVSAQFKSFMDQTGDFWLEQLWKNKIAAGFTIATSPSGDKLGTLNALMMFAMQHGMIWVGQDHLGSVHTKDGKNINGNGSWLGLMGQTNPDKTKLIFEGDELTAIRFGERVAQIAMKLKC